MDDIISRQAAIDALGDKPEPSAQLDVPDTNVGDMISRQAAIDALSFGKEMLNRVLDDMDVVGTEREKYSWGLGLIESSIENIEELPSAQPERKTGKWKLNKDGNWACPFCEFDPYHDNMKGMNFCPNCGARMEVEHDTSD